MVKKFLVDHPLGGLVKWLRFCGFDAACQSLRASDPKGLPSPEDGVYLLTSQTVFLRLKRPDILVVQAATPEAQLDEITRRLGLSRRHLSPLNRCSRCNEVLTQVHRDLVKGQLPDHVFHSQSEFYECPRCQRLYWPGSHHDAIAARLEKVVSD